MFDERSLIDRIDNVYCFMTALICVDMVIFILLDVVFTVVQGSFYLCCRDKQGQEEYEEAEECEEFI